MPKILGGAGIGREHFENRAGGERLQRTPRLQHRQWAQQSGGIEGRIHRQIASLRHLSAPYGKRTLSNCNKLPNMQQTARAEDPQNGNFAVFAGLELSPAKGCPSRALGKEKITFKPLRLL